jgi:hypothetical protein
MFKFYKKYQIFSPVGNFFAKFQSTNPEAKSGLFKLRKLTGYALSKCKEALEKHNNSVEQV